MKEIFFLILLAVSLNSFGQTGIGTTTPDGSAQLDVSSTSKGFLLPRMTAAQRTAISNPATGLLVFQTDATAGYYYYNGAAWLNLETQLVNDLTTGGTTAALTAEQGKALQDNKLDKTTSLSGDVSGTYTSTVIGTGKVKSVNIEDGAVTSADIANSTIDAADLSSMGASSGQVLKWNGAAWVASNDNISSGGELNLIASASNASSISFTRTIGKRYKIIVSPSASNSWSAIRINDATSNYKYSNAESSIGYGGGTNTLYYNSTGSDLIIISPNVGVNTCAEMDLTFHSTAFMSFTSDWASSSRYGETRAVYTGTTSSTVTVNFGITNPWTWSSTTVYAVNVYEY